MMLFNAIAYLLALVVSLPLLVLAAECFLSLLPSRKGAIGDRSRCAVLIPAHNEEDVLARTLENVHEQLAADDRLIVVADNCTDRTVEIARLHDSEIVIRNDSERRGKGFALDAGARYLESTERQQPDEIGVVVILDADCMFAPGALDHLVRAATNGEHPFQAQYLMHAPSASKPARRLSAFAFLTKNLVRPRGLNRLGLCVPLTGSGMAFPWRVLKDLELATSEIVEDLQLGLNLVVKGHGPVFCESARVDSFFPDSDTAARQQRTRWEHGYVGQMRRMLPRLLAQGIKGNVQAMGSALDLMVPPLSLLVLIAAMTAALLTGYYAISSNVIPVLLLLTSCSLASLGLASIWACFGRDTVTFSEILSIPIYVGRKVSMYLVLPFRSEREWKRTERTRQKTAADH